MVTRAGVTRTNAFSQSEPMKMFKTLICMFFHDRKIKEEVLDDKSVVRKTYCVQCDRLLNIE